MFFDSSLESGLGGSISPYSLRSASARRPIVDSKGLRADRREKQLTEVESHLKRSVTTVKVVWMFRGREKDDDIRPEAGKSDVGRV